MKYEEMSDFEINKLVVLAIDSDGDIESVTQRKSKLKCISNQALVKIKGVDGLEPFNACNNPSDAWQIIVESGISVMMTAGSCGDLWTCGVANFHDGSWDFDNEKTGEYVDFETYDDNPLRAAMICFLKMKDAQ